MSEHRPREIQLTSKQLVFVFMSTVLVAVVVFLLGVWVGRGIDTGSLAATDQVVNGGAKATSPSPPSSGVPPATIDPKPLSYPETLAGSGSNAPATSAPQSQATPQPADSSTSAAPAPPAADKPPPPPEKAPAEQPAASGDDSWVIQVGAYSARSGAEKVAAGFKAKGYPVTVTPGPTFRVRIGPYPRKTADQIAARLRKEGQDSSVIRSR